jgi:hypothetical protein
MAGFAFHVLKLETGGEIAKKPGRSLEAARSGIERAVLTTSWAEVTRVLVNFTGTSVTSGKLAFAI